MRFRLRNKNRSDDWQEKSNESRLVRCFGRGGESQRVVGCPVRFVMVAVLMMVAIIMVAVVLTHICNRSRCIIEMRLSSEMSRDVIDVEGEQQRDQETTPPTRLSRRAA